MTDHNQQTVDLIASAIYQAMNRADIEGPFHTALAASESDRHDAGLYMTKVTTARVAARAALDALPQPIGYGIHIESAWTQWLDENTFTTRQEAVREATSSGYDPYDERTTTIVALIPIDTTGDTHA